MNQQPLLLVLLLMLLMLLMLMLMLLLLLWGGCADAGQGGALGDSDEPARLRGRARCTTGSKRRQEGSIFCRG